LLPRWRGAAPINRAIMAGGAETGGMAVRMDEGLDTGPLAMAERMAIEPDMNAGGLPHKLARLGGGPLVRARAAPLKDAPGLWPQPDAGVSYAAKIDKSESRIDWSKPSKAVHDHCRGLSPFPGAWFEMAADGKPVRVKVLRTKRADGRGVPGHVLDDKLTIA